MSSHALVLVALLPFLVPDLAAAAVPQGPPHNGPRPVTADWYALQGARVVTAPGNSLDRATIVVHDGVITAVGDEAPPAGATIVDCTGLVIWPGLIEPFYPSDVPAIDPTATDQHWNAMVQPQRDALDGALVTAADREALRKLGFAAAAVAPSGGILKGTSALVLLDEPQATSPPRVVRTPIYMLASLQTSRDGYPDSEMGAIALLRQMLLDGQWYERCMRTVANDPSLASKAPQSSNVLQAIVDTKNLPLWFDVQDELQALRTLKVANEFERKAVIVGSGMEFRRLQALAAAKATIVEPLHMPDTPDVSTQSAADRVSLRQLQSWEQAPTNTKRLLDAGLTVAWTTARLRDKKDFSARARDAIACGVTPDQALAALTTIPAKLLGVDDRLGTIGKGKIANLVVTTGDLFAEKTEVRDVWVGGTRHVIAGPKDQGLDGSWAWTAGFPAGGDAHPSLAIDGDKVTCKLGDAELKSTGVQRDATTLTCRLSGKELGGDGAFWLRLHRDGEQLAGVCSAPDGRSWNVRATTAPPLASADTKKDDTKKEGKRDGQREGRDGKKEGGDEKFVPPSLDPLATPLGGYGFLERPAALEFVITGATLWTCDGRGNVRDGALHVREGRIVYAGPRADMPPAGPGAVVIDGTGKHVTPGVIDCHSHTGISRGVNEGGQAVTAEVRIEDVIDPDDVNWYRQLAGGVTLVNQLHGSANAIGGQSCTTKVRFGALDPDEMKLQGAPAGMKWALGENPRRANGRDSNPRYPNTRMGVEALLRDRFAAAEVHRAEHAAYAKLSPAERAKVLPPRRDLELEAIGEILSGTRMIHCHSYRQDEIFMLCNLAKEHGIKIGTFQHVLEGYKVADTIAANSNGASSFSDWWAYKFEVYDAIPDNGAIMHEVGACVSFNSDSNEHARRLNSEAGKAIKYGHVAPPEALCFVTRNPAMQLGIFARTGSLTAGKDADVAMWSDDPLSYRARCEATWVDGRQLFSLAHDAEARTSITNERQRLLQKALASGKGRTARERDPKDAYWAAEDLNHDYCCRTAEEVR